MHKLFERVFPANTEVLAEVRSAAHDACQLAHCSDKCSDQIVLAINEACMNVIQHGYQFAAGQYFTLQLSVNDGVFVANLLDNGLPASDTDLQPRSLDELRPGGLGVRFMRELMDGVAYLPVPDGFANCLQLSKRIF
jgi:sigma-B regulation protein RsbU (phosphoserine phosphatase)